MTRETRFNLIFILILIPLLLPGGILLFRAKLDPEARRMFQPDFTRRESVYINYDDQRPDAPRVVPPITGQWVQFEAQRLLHPEMRSHMTWLRGAASADHRYEVVAMSSSPDAGCLLAVITWDPKIVDPTFTLNDKAMTQTNHFKLDVPTKVRGELQKAGFVTPPGQLQAYLLQSPEPCENRTLIAHFAAPPDLPTSDSVTLPGPSAVGATPAEPSPVH